MEAITVQGPNEFAKKDTIVREITQSTRLTEIPRNNKKGKPNSTGNNMLKV